MYWTFQRLNNQKVASVFNCWHLWNDPVNLLDLCQLKISKICHCISLFTYTVNFPVSFCSSDVIVTCLLTRQQLFTVWSNVDSTKSPRPPSRYSPNLPGRWSMSCNIKVKLLVSELFCGAREDQQSQFTSDPATWNTAWQQNVKK